MIVGQDTKKQIQKIIIADETNYTTIQLWEEDMYTLQEHTSYRFNNITTSEYYGENYFTFSTNSSATQIEDIGSVVKPPADDSEMPTDAPKEYDDVYYSWYSPIQSIRKKLVQAMQRENHTFYFKPKNWDLLNVPNASES